MGDELKEIRDEFLAEAQETLELLDQRFVALEAAPDNRELLDEIFRAMHSMKGAAGFLGFTRLVDVAHRAETILNRLRRGEMAVSRPVIDAVLESVDVVKAMLAGIREFGSDAPVASAPVADRLAGLAGPSGLPRDRGRSLRVSEKDETLRVETRRLDNVMNLVGELVLERNRLMKLGGGLGRRYESDRTVAELSDTLAQVNLLTTELQLAVMRARMVPVRKVLGKLPRMVRDLAQRLGKKVRLEMLGEDTELDKSVADELGGLLGHLVRNAVDHGIEPPGDRERAGKPGEGIVRIAVSRQGDSIAIRIEDDGRGLQVGKIKARALARGLVSEAELAGMEPRDLFDLICLPGFTTVEEATDVSGRGVGMDVVRAGIRKLNGGMAIDSSPGQDTTMTLVLPLTIAIIQALLVEAGSSTFAIPLASVSEVVKVAARDLKTVAGREVLHLRDRVLPLLRLAEELGILPDSTREAFYVVVAGLGDRQVGLIVDLLRSREEVVVKPLGDSLVHVNGIVGATITGEGRVVLILDVPELVANARPGRTAA
jgi:two-component system chemotaxis sensor kinase CheA